VDAPVPSSHVRRPPPAVSIVELVAAGTIDAELAALVWLLVEGRVPLMVAALARGAGKTTLLDASLAFLSPGVERHELCGPAEDLSWLRAADPERTYLVAAELSDHRPTYIWGEGARAAVRAVQDGFGLGATLHADTLEGFFASFEAPPVSLTTDEIRRLGVVLILRVVRNGPRTVASAGTAGSLGSALGPARRVVAAHYLRPLERDMHGHLQRRPPAVLATWDPETDTFEHFAWGVSPELAARVGREQAAFERSHERRRRFLQGLLAAGRLSSDELTAALAVFRRTEADGPALAGMADDHQRHHAH
jgi:hypothetical protein